MQGLRGRLHLRAQPSEEPMQASDCGGASICEHDRQRAQCKDCGGASICEHNRVRSKCVDCGGASICAHRRVRSRCKGCKRRKTPAQLHILTHHEMRGVRVERLNGYSNETGCVVYIASGTQCHARSYPMQRPLPVEASWLKQSAPINHTRTRTHLQSRDARQPERGAASCQSPQPPPPRSS